MSTPIPQPTCVDPVFDLTPSKFDIAPPERQVLRNIARHTLGDQLEEKVDASDVVQESLTAAWTARAKFRGESRSDFLGWLKRIVKNRALNTLRFFSTQRRQVSQETYRTTDHAAGKHPDERTPSQSVIRREDAARIVALLERLPAAERKAISLRYLEDLPLEKIAKQLGRSTAASAGVLKRGMKRLRELMLERHSTEKDHG